VVRNFRRFVIVCLLLTLQTAHAAEKSENVFPADTTGYLSVQDPEQLKTNFQKTQIGRLFQDERFKPFAKVLGDQLRGKLNDAKALGITWDDIKALGSGEGAIAAVQPDGKPGKHAVAAFAVITGHKKEVDALLAKVDAAIRKKGGEKTTEAINGRNTITYTFRDQNQQQIKREAHYRISADHLIVSNNIDVLNGMSDRLDGKAKETSLAANPGFKRIMERCTTKRMADLRWFINPIGYVETVRAAHPDPRFDGNILKAFKVEGFESVSALGGTSIFGDEKQEMLHRIKFYVPGDAKTLHARLTKSARVLDFPNSEGQPLKPEKWVPPTVASYFSLNFNMAPALERATPLLNRLLGAEDGENLVGDVIEGIKKDEFGPQIDIESEILAHLAGRLTAISTHRKPINTESGRWLIAIKVRNPKRVSKAIDKLMGNERNAKKIHFLKENVWEVTEEEEEEATVLQIDDGFGVEDEEAEDEFEEQERLISSFALMVLKGTQKDGYLMISSHIDFIGDVIKQHRNPKTTLDQSPDYIAVERALARVGGDTQCVRQFSRPAEVMAPSYELLRQGKMPEAKTIVGKVINRAMNTKQGEIRDQKIDGKKMPPYDVVREYLGVSGLTATSEADGWFTSSLLLKK